jgi:D-lactate dehydrogenase
MDVYFYEAFEEEAAALRRFLPAGVNAQFDARTVQETGHADDDAPPAPLISTRTQSRIPIAWADRLAGILTRSTGYDHLLAYAAQTGRRVPMGYLPRYCHRACAEQAMMLALTLLRRLPRQIAQFQQFHRDGLTGAEALDKTMLIVGVGHIGHEVHRLASAFDMHTLGVDLDPRHDDIDYVSLNEGLERADVIVCAMNLTDDNRGYFDEATLAECRRGAIFVNVSRGELSPSTALLAALETGQLAGVGLDVYDHEAELAVALRSGRAGSDDAQAAAAIALSRREDAICTPHNAFNTLESVARKSEHSMRQVDAFVRTGRFLWPVP